MLRCLCFGLLVLMMGAGMASARASFPADLVKTTAGDLEITFIGHGTLMMTFAGKVIHIDPYGKLADYATLPKADMVLLTHHHGDHLDQAAIDRIRTSSTTIVLTETCAASLTGGIVMRNGDSQTCLGVGIEAVPAYNLVHKRENGQPFHPRGEGNGYLLSFGQTRVYVAGDTENTPEMKALKNVDLAFLPMNLPYTMTPEMVADAVRAFQPRIVYPYHFGDTDTSQLGKLLADLKTVEIRIRPMK
jgi:L-ascorbate metabolism protein UlaG (beta-lactamase superfamily)